MSAKVGDAARILYYNMGRTRPSLPGERLCRLGLDVSETEKPQIESLRYLYVVNVAELPALTGLAEVAVVSTKLQ